MIADKWRELLIDLGNDIQAFGLRGLADACRNAAAKGSREEGSKAAQMAVDALGHIESAALVAGAKAAAFSASCNEDARARDTAGVASILARVEAEKRAFSTHAKEAAGLGVIAEDAFRECQKREGGQ